MENLAGQVIKGYELRERIGAGGFGAVYKAFQSTVGREVAVKIILPLQKGATRDRQSLTSKYNRPFARNSGKRPLGIPIGMFDKEVRWTSAQQ